MPAGTFPVPKDVRTARAFTIVKGIDKMIRTPGVLADPTVNIDPGEWVTFDANGEIVKATAAADINSPLMGARAVWTLYRQGDASAGQSDAMATGQVDLLSGSYQAKTQLYDPNASWLPGAQLIVIHNGAGDYGELSPLDPSAVDVEMLSGVVGVVVVVPTDGVLHYESR